MDGHNTAGGISQLDALVSRMSASLNTRHTAAPQGVTGAHHAATPASATPYAFTQAQQVLLKTYAQGDFEHLLGIPTKEELHIELERCDDGLLRFLVIELAASEDCRDAIEALSRTESIIVQLTALRDQLLDLIED